MSGTVHEDPVVLRAVVHMMNNITSLDVNVKPLQHSAVSAVERRLVPCQHSEEVFGGHRLATVIHHESVVHVVDQRLIVVDFAGEGVP